MEDQSLSGENTEVTTPVIETESQLNVSQQTAQPEDTGSTGVDDTSREGFISALQAERNKAAIESQKAEFYRQQYEEKIRQQSQTQNQQPVQQTPKYNPDEIPDIRTVEEILNEKIGTVVQAQQQAARKTQVDAMENAARAKHSDYDEVVAKAVEMANFLEPGYKAAILNATNPAEMAYQIGKLHPDYINKEKQLKSQAKMDAIKTNAQKPPTLSQMGSGGSVQQQAGYYKNMSKDEWSAKIAAVKARD